MMMRSEHAPDRRPLEDKVQEVVDRSRRIETRLTKYLEEQGFTTQGRRPVWSQVEDIGRLDIPAMGCSVGDCLSAIPATYPKSEEVLIYHNGKFVMALTQD
jgi:hypothetical protein